MSDNFIKKAYVVILAAYDVWDTFKRMVWGCCAVFIIGLVAHTFNWLLALTLFAAIPVGVGVIYAVLYQRMFDDGELVLREVPRDDKNKGDK